MVGAAAASLVVSGSLPSEGPWPCRGAGGAPSTPCFPGIVHGGAYCGLPVCKVTWCLGAAFGDTRASPVIQMASATLTESYTCTPLSCTPVSLISGGSFVQLAPSPGPSLGASVVTPPLMCWRALRPWHAKRARVSIHHGIMASWREGSRDSCNPRKITCRLLMSVVIDRVRVRPYMRRTTPSTIWTGFRSVVL